MDDLRKNPSVPEHLRKKFNSTYREVENNLAWFKNHHLKIGEYSKAVVHRLGLDVDVEPKGSTLAPHVDPPKTLTTEKPTAPPSSASPKPPSSSLILQVVLATFLVSVSYYF